MKYLRKMPYDIVKIKIDNLRRIIDSTTIDYTISSNMFITSDMTDALNLSYYQLKDIFCKIDRRKYGVINSVNFTPTIVYQPISSEYGTYDVSTSYYTSTTNKLTDTLTTNSAYTYGTYGTSAAVFYKPLVSTFGITN